MFTKPSIKVEIKRLDANIPIPSVSTSDVSCGYVIYGYDPAHVETKDFGYIEYRTGFSLNIPDGYCGTIYPLKSISETGLILANSCVVIDSQNTDEIKIRFKYVKGTHLYTHGTPVAKIVFIKIENVEFVDIPIVTEPQNEA